MANFKVGQRVKKVRHRDPSHFRRLLTAHTPLGTEGVVYEIGDGEYLVHFAGDGVSWLLGYQLAPLTDPKADAFIESVKKWGPLHEEPKRDGGLVVKLPQELLRRLRESRT